MQRCAVHPHGAAWQRSELALQHPQASPPIHVPVWDGLSWASPSPSVEMLHMHLLLEFALAACVDMPCLRTDSAPCEDNPESCVQVVKPSCSTGQCVSGCMRGLVLVHAPCRYMPSPEVPAQVPGTPLQTKNLFKHVQVRACLAGTLIADPPLLVQ